MTISSTVRMGLTQWSAETDTPSRSQFGASFAAIDANAAMFLQDVIASRPAASIEGRFYFATDVEQLWYDNGTTWVPANVQAAQATSGYPTLAGANSVFRIGGATSGGPPTSGSWQVGDIVFDTKNGIIWFCTAAGSPGQWGTSSLHVSSVATTNGVGGFILNYPYPIYGPGGAAPIIVPTFETLPAPSQRAVIVSVIHSDTNNVGWQGVAWWSQNAGAATSEMTPAAGEPLTIDYSVGIATT